MAASKTREELDRDWWEQWWAEDLSWDGLKDKPWRGWSVDEATGAVTETLATDAGTRPATLQDYWRLDASGVGLRSDAEMAGELVRVEGQMAFHTAHLPLHYKDGTPAKAVWSEGQKATFNEILKGHFDRAAETTFEGDWRERRVVGADWRAQLQGVVLFGMPTIRRGASFSARFERAYFVERADFDRATFSADANFSLASFARGARFDGATFSGQARFDGATFAEAAHSSDDEYLDMPQMLGNLKLLDTGARKRVVQMLDDLRVPDSERKEVEKNLSEAIAADLLVRLGGQLSEVDKAELAQMGEKTAPGQAPDLELVATFFRSRFSQKELIDTLAEAAESVYTEFVDAMKRPDNATVSAGVGIDRATSYSAAITAGVRFDGATFSETACFLWTSFCATVRFDRANFIGDARFDNAIFSEDASFQETGFKKTAIFQPNSVNTPVFLKKCDFGSAAFDGLADFSGLHFVGDADFNRTNFIDRAFFEDCKFLNEATFERCSFVGIASFADGEFTRATSFEYAHFSGRANFSSTKFLQTTGDGRLNFSAVHFADMANFESAKFPTSCWRFSAAFDGARFDGVAYFGDTGLDWIAALHGATLEKTLILDRVSHSDADKRFFRVILPATRKGVAADVLAKTKREEGARARRASQRDHIAEPVTKAEKRRWKRELPEQRLKELEGGCRVVKVAMGRQRDEASEQRYYRFQLVSHRHQSDTALVEKLYSWLYGAFADYGLGLWRPLATLLFLVLAFASIFWSWGEMLRGWPDEAWQLSPARPVDQDIWDALLFSANNMFRPLSVWSAEFGPNSGNTWIADFVGAFGIPDEGGQRLAIRLASTLQSLLSVVLFFLFALAVRRRFQIH